jgi:hypothetical protein
MERVKSNWLCAQLAIQDTRAAGAAFDMFAEEGQDASAAMTGGDKTAAAAGLADSYDDPEGYYNLQARVEEGRGLAGLKPVERQCNSLSFERW